MDIQEELTRRLTKNGWAWHLVSTVTPGVVRIQMGDDGDEETGWRKCVEAPTLEEAIVKGEELVNSINAYDYGRDYYGAPPSVNGDHVVPPFV